MLVDVHISLRDGDRDTLRIKPFLHRLDDIEVNPPVIVTLHPGPDLENHFAICQLLDENRGLWVLEYPRIIVDDRDSSPGGEPCRL